jgi:hypothetical protein
LRLLLNKRFGLSLNSINEEIVLSLVKRLFFSINLLNDLIVVDLCSSILPELSKIKILRIWNWIGIAVRGVVAFVVWFGTPTEGEVFGGINSNMRNNTNAIVMSVSNIDRIQNFFYFLDRFLKALYNRTNCKLKSL